MCLDSVTVFRCLSNMTHLINGSESDAASLDPEDMKRQRSCRVLGFVSVRTGAEIRSNPLSFPRANLVELLPTCTEKFLTQQISLKFMRM